MERIDFFIHKIYYFIPGSLYGLFAMMIRMYGDLVAVLLYPGYNPAIHMISFLGTGPGHMFFNLGLFFSATLVIPFYFSFANILKNEFPEDAKLIQGSLKVSLISAFSVSLVGFFLGISNFITNQLLYDFHAFFAVIAFICAVYSCYISGSLMKKSTQFPKTLAYMSYAVSVLCVIFLLTWHALIEWVSTYFMVIWQISVCVYMIYKRM